MADTPSSFAGITRAPVVEKDGRATSGFLRLMMDWNTRLTNALNRKGELVGTIGDVATIHGRAEPIKTTLQHMSSTGTLAASAVTGTLASGNLPGASLGSIGGVTANNATAHQWVNAIAAGGVPQLSQPGFGDILGTASPAQLPTPTTTTIGGVKAVNAVVSEWVDSISTAGVPHLSQPAFTDISGVASTAQIPVITAAQLPASVPVVSFGAGAPGGSSTEGYIYFDTAGSPYHGYVWHSGAWAQFS